MREEREYSSPRMLASMEQEDTQSLRGEGQSRVSFISPHAAAASPTKRIALDYQRACARVVFWSCILALPALVIIIILTFAWKEDTPDGYGGYVSSEQHLATQAGLRILRDGGNAFDAAAVVQLVLGVVQPQSTGIGGGCFVAFFTAKDGSTHALDGREEAYESLTEDAFCKDAACNETWPFMPDRVTGGHPVGVPGVLAATARLLHDYGTLTLAQALQPAIDIARKGFPMYEHLHSRIVLNRERLSWFNASAELFLEPDRSAPRVALGETFANPDLADTLELIAKEGESAFYGGGAIGQDLVAAVAAARNPITGLVGNITLADLQRYRAVYRAPVSSKHLDRTIVGPPPPAGSAALLQEMALVGEGALGVEPGPLRSPTSRAEGLRRMMNAQNVAFADRDRYLADPDWVDVPLPGMLDPAYIKSRRAATVDKHPGAAVPLPIAPGKPPGVTPSAAAFASSDPSPRSGTTHFAVVDGDRNMVSWTTTIEENLGSAVVVPGRGFLLNNELTDFDGLPRDPATGKLRANRPQGGLRPRRTALGEDHNTLGGKRPRSSMSPTLVLKDDRAVLGLGSPGGSAIIGTVFNVLARILNDGDSLETATRAPRVVSRNFNPAYMEQTLYNDTAVLQRVEGFGFNVSSEFGPRPIGFVQSVAVDGDGVTGFADPRLPAGSAEGC